MAPDLQSTRAPVADAVENRRMPVPTLVVLSAVLVALATCSFGVFWELAIMPTMDDSDPDAYIGTGFLLCGLPAAAFAAASLAVLKIRWIRSEGVAEGLGITSITFGLLPVLGLACWEALFLIAGALNSSR